MDSIFSHWSGKYLELGYQPIPVQQKVARLPGWSAFCRKPMDQLTLDQIIDDFSWMGDAGVGLATGLGYVAIDIDSDDERLAQYLSSVLPHTPMVKAGRTGRTYFYRVEGEHPAQRSYEMPVELLAIGAQTVVPPSRHSKGIVYKWIGQGPVPREELPLLENPARIFEQLINFCRDNFILRQVKNVQRHETDQGELPDTLGREGRNNRLTAKAYQLACHMKFPVVRTEAELVQELIDYDLAVHKSAAWLQDPNEAPGTPQAKAAKFIKRAIAACKAKNKMWEEYDIAFHEFTDKPDAEPTAAAQPTTITPDSALWKRGTPADYQRLLNQVPWLKFWSKYNADAAVNYSEALTLGTGLALLACMGSNVVSFEDNWSNLFILNVAPTGFGKDVNKFIKKLLTEVRVRDGIVVPSSGKYKSSAVIYRGFNKTNRRYKLDVHDEVAEFLDGMNVKTGPLNGAVGVMADLWSASSSGFGDLEAQDKERQISEVTNPCLSWLGSTVPKGIRNAVGSDAMVRGLGSRMLYFIDGMNEGRTVRKPLTIGGRRLSSHGFPEQVVAVASRWLGMDVSYKKQEGRYNLQGQPNEAARPLDVPSLQVVDLEACNEYLRLLNHEIEQFKNGRDPEDPLCILLSRREQMMCKLMCCWYVGHDGKRELDVEALRWADEVCALSLGNVVEYLASGSVPLTERVVDATMEQFKSGEVVRVDNMKRAIGRCFKRITGLEPREPDLKAILQGMMGSQVEMAGRDSSRKLVCRVL